MHCFFFFFSSSTFHYAVFPLISFLSNCIVHFVNHSPKWNKTMMRSNSTLNMHSGWHYTFFLAFPINFHRFTENFRTHLGEHDERPIFENVDKVWSYRLVYLILAICMEISLLSAQRSYLVFNLYNLQF